MTSKPEPSEQKKILLSPPHMSGRERVYLDEVFETNFVAPAGPMLAQFESMFCEATEFPNAVAVSSGTAALHLALRCLGVGPGDRVWAPTFTFIATVAPIVYQQATPVLFDCDADTWNIDLDLIAEELPRAEKQGELPKAIIAADIYGQPCDIQRLRSLAQPYGIEVISDSAESIGSSIHGKHAGAGATATAFSFNGNKLLTTGGGGLLASDDADLIDHARNLSQQARQPVPHYEHHEIGFNYRMSALNAAVGCAQLEVLEERVSQRRAIFERYKHGLEHFSGISFQGEMNQSVANRWLTALSMPERCGPPDEAVARLDSTGIEVRRLWKPLHLQKALAGVRSVGGEVAENVYRKGICLPSGSIMTEGDVDRVIATLSASWSTT